MTGTIKRLNTDKGFGFIRNETGQEYFFHQSAIYGEGIADLREGDSVEFDIFIFLSNIIVFCGVFNTFLRSWAVGREPRT